MKYPLSADKKPVKPNDKVYSVLSGDEFTIRDVNFRGWADFGKNGRHSHSGFVVWYAKDKLFALTQKFKRLDTEMVRDEALLQEKRQEYLNCLKEMDDWETIALTKRAIKVNL